MYADKKMGRHQQCFVCIFIKQTTAPPFIFHLHGDLYMCVRWRRERKRAKLRENIKECVRAEWSNFLKVGLVNYCFPSLTEHLNCSF